MLLTDGLCLILKPLFFSVYAGRCRGILPQLCRKPIRDSVAGSRGQLKSDIGKVLDRNDARVADVGLPSLMSCLALQLPKMQKVIANSCPERNLRRIFDWFWQRVQESVPGSLG